MIKHADFQLYSYLENLEIGDKFVHKEFDFLYINRGISLKRADKKNY